MLLADFDAGGFYENSRQRCWHLVTELGKLFIKEDQHERSQL
jgi:hypothetical protein